MLTNEQIRVPQIKAARLSALLILSRMFIILIFLPNTHHSVGGSVAILSIIVGFFLTFLVMIPLFFLLGLADFPALFQIYRWPHDRTFCRNFVS